MGNFVQGNGDFAEDAELRVVEELHMSPQCNTVLDRANVIFGYTRLGSKKMPNMQQGRIIVREGMKFNGFAQCKQRVQVTQILPGNALSLTVIAG
ncbi:hypothetical protein llap_9169 [Limosa lapponica baueri]|uniref:Uncharacterized protein n=1 Tax=Limosa lapponica baueri TaxID=1758121 RepID=A0A2I0U363_LIMLA|nr:hypothetical protein llap_9169 [Limosa lapponica baueri]